MRGDFEDRDDNKKMNSMLFTTAFAVSLFVITVVLIVVLINTVGKENERKRAAQREALQAEEAVEDEAEEEITVGTLTPDDFDFWDKYPDEPLKEEDIRKPSDSNATDDSGSEDDPSKDGKHTLVINRDGTEEWVLISQYLAKNDYDYTNLVSQDGLM